MHVGVVLNLKLAAPRARNFRFRRTIWSSAYGVIRLSNSEEIGRLMSGTIKSQNFIDSDLVTSPKFYCFRLRDNSRDFGPWQGEAILDK